MNKHKVEDYFNFVFPEGESFFTRKGRFTIIKGDPGAGKTTLSLEIARRISEDKRTVFFISLEQELKSLKLSMRRLAGTFGKYLESNRCVFYNEDTGWNNCNEIEVDLGVTIFFRPPVGFKSSQDLILWIQSKISEAKEKLGCSCGLVIIDNANVYVPKESKLKKEPHGTTGKTETKQLTLANPLNRESLQEIKYLAINQNASLLLVVEQDRNHENLEIDFYADAVIKLNKTDSEVANLIVAKSRHFPTSPGTHKVRFTANSNFNICPSPESILLSSKLKTFNYYTSRHKKQFYASRFPGWEESFKNSSLLKYQDIILISGNRHSGKAIIRDQFVNSANNGAILYWRKDASYTLRSNEIKVDSSDITDANTLLKLLDENDLLESDFGIPDSMPLIRKNLENQNNEKARTLLAKIINNYIINPKTFDKYINSEQFALNFGDHEDHLRDQYNSEQYMLLNRQIIEKLFHGQIKKLRQNFSLAPNPSWDSNRLFFEIYQAVTKLFGYSFNDCVLGIDNLELMLDSFPKIKMNKQFLANLFALFRCLNLTVISTISPNNCSMGLEAENLADVVLKTNFLPTVGGSLEILEIHSKERRGNAPEEKIGFDPIRGEVSSELLHTFKIAPNGKASRVNINITMPYYSQSEIKHAHDVCEGISNFVGSKHVALTGITNNKICNGKSNSKFLFTVKDTNKVNTSALLSRLSAYPHDDLNILTIDDYFLTESWQRQLDSYLEPLG
ncbi:hypothetical protein KAR91_26580, partial [Candidatus Pacearchaeota archaeon]|nr:hypothetical protein [Candidatus Pacearchaeota archaeon]